MNQVKIINTREEIISINTSQYEQRYSNKQHFLQYPADWLIRFHNMYLKHHIPSDAKCLDYGCGGGNNSIFLMEKGYNVYGVDVAPSFISLVEENLSTHAIPQSVISNFHTILPCGVLPYEDNYFDFILSNQVLYYLPSTIEITEVCAELKRVLKPNGIVFFTMMGVKNYYYTHHLRQIHNECGEVFIEDKSHRLSGVRENIFFVKDEAHLTKIFNTFEKITIGYFDQSMFDLYSNFHWIFVGKNNKPKEI